MVGEGVERLEEEESSHLPIVTGQVRNGSPNIKERRE